MALIVINIFICMVLYEFIFYIQILSNNFCNLTDKKINNLNIVLESFY
jgi:hypothetical protein